MGYSHPLGFGGQCSTQWPLRAAAKAAFCNALARWAFASPPLPLAAPGAHRIWRRKANRPEGSSKGPRGCAADPQPRPLRPGASPAWLPGRACGARAPWSLCHRGESQLSDNRKRRPRNLPGAALVFAGERGLRPLAPGLLLRAGRGRVFVDLLAAADGLFQIGVDPLGRPGPIPPGKIPVEGLGVVV